jgi:hypothetical protein
MFVMERRSCAVVANVMRSRHKLKGTSMTKDDDIVVGYLDMLDYAKRTAWLKLGRKSDKRDRFEFSEIWIEALRNLWGDRVRCVIGNDWQLKKITRVSK